MTPEQIVPTTLRLHCGIILQATTPRAEGFANKSSARWLRTQSIDDIINKGELIPTWDKLGPIDPWLDEESDGEDSDETVSKKQKLNSQEPLARAYRKRFEHWGKALIANMISMISSLRGIWEAKWAIR